MPSHPVDQAGTSPADESAGAVRAGRIRPGAVTAAVITAEAFLISAAVALIESGPLRWIAGAAGLLVVVAYAVPVRGRRLYRWIPVLVRFRRGRAGADPGPSAEGIGLLPALLPGLRVTTSNVGRAVTPVGIAHDGQAWVGMLAIEREDLVGGKAPDLPLGRLAAQLDLAGGGPGAVQVLLRLIPAGEQDDAGAAPLARQAWIALRLDPLAQRKAAGRAKSVGEVQKSLARGIHRAAELLESAGVRCRVLDDDGVREALRRAQAEPDGTPLTESRTALTAQARHTSYRLQRWPSGGFSALLAATNAIAAPAVTVSVTVSAFENGEAAVTAQVRTSRPPEEPAADRETERAAAEVGVRLVALRAEQAEGFLATLPLSRAAAPGNPAAADMVVAHDDAEKLRLPLDAPGLVLGVARDGLALRAQLLRPRPTHAGLFGQIHVAQILALRMLLAGVPVHVVTGRPAVWASLRAAAGQLELHPPGSGPEDAGSGRPLLVVDDTEGQAVVGMRRNISAWQAVVVVRSHVSIGDARLLRSYDAVLFQHVSGPSDPLAAVLPADAVSWASQPRPGVVGVWAAGAVSFVNVGVTSHEQSLLTGQRAAEPASRLAAADGKR